MSPTALAVGWVVSSLARAATPDLSVVSSAAVVPGSPTPAVVVPTLGPDVAFDAGATPTLRLGVSATAGLSLGPRDRLSARWGVWREQRACDTCGDGAGPVGVGPDLLGSTDLDLTATHRFDLAGAGELWTSGLLTLPASRDALACDPLVGAPGAGATFRLPVGPDADRRALLSVGVSARRPVYTHGAAPVGRCDTGAVPRVDTLAGAVSARSWAGERWGAAHPALSTAGSVALQDPEDLIPGIDRRFTSTLSVGLLAVRDARAPAVDVATLAGTVEVPAAAEPVAVQVPWSVSAGWALGARAALAASASNRLPAVLADPGGAFRAQPASTSFALSLSTSFPSLEDR